MICPPSSSPSACTVTGATDRTHRIEISATADRARFFLLFFLINIFLLLSLNFYIHKMPPQKQKDHKGSNPPSRRALQKPPWSPGINNKKAMNVIRFLRIFDLHGLD